VAAVAKRDDYWNCRFFRYVALTTLPFTADKERKRGAGSDREIATTSARRVRTV
jgi:hypothetical protein